MGGGGINWKIGIDVYTLLYIKYITNKELLYSTGNSTQYSLMVYMGNLKKSGDIYLYIYISIYIYIYRYIYIYI